VDPEPIPLGGVAPRRDTAMPTPTPDEGGEDDGSPGKGGDAETEPPIPELEDAGDQAELPQQPEHPMVNGGIRPPTEPAKGPR
jgi:hypothetical protein